jgi:regulator of protease activity HflC (stomatin/prohibitin superfamily)
MNSELDSTVDSRTQERDGVLGVVALGALAAVVLVAYLAPSIFIAVGPGQAGVLWRRFWGGTELERAYGEGTVVIFPWDELHVYDMTFQHIRVHTTVHSADGLALDATVSARFRIDDERVPRLHAEIGPDYVTKLVEPELLASVRSVIGRYSAEEVYASGDLGLLGALGDDFRARLSPFDLSCGDVQLERIVVPAGVQDAIQRKLASEQDVLREEQEKQRRTIEAEGIATFEAIAGVPIIRWGALAATSELARSPNSKVIVIGNDQKSLPVLLNAEGDAGGEVAAETPPTDAAPAPAPE